MQAANCSCLADGWLVQVLGHLLEGCVEAGVTGADLFAQADQRLSDHRLGEWPPQSVAAALSALSTARHRSPDDVLQHVTETAARCACFGV